ncbi:MAG: transaldolase [Confluentimicrobium sp.]|nr:transaldolase [Actibacterium sp.]MBF54028.1 transaldolase [Actibacterium sp.]OWU70785.1 transaldolase [Roseovarius sp. 22II1-1F6A]|tara:strand:- start:756 stop:1697 length:942 start_codon:yes stop_codon:yes gene_type:complete
MTALESLRDMTVVVADTGDIDAIRKLTPVDCTTNPSILLKALQSPAFEDLVTTEIEAGKAAGKSALDVADALTIGVGVELTKLVPGRVSTEVDANLSFDTEASIAKGRAIIAGYEAKGVSRDRILIKLASTWEGIRAAEKLEAEGIQCNLTLLFAQCQAIACANAGVFLISPFVGRITDWYSKAEGGKTYTPDEDPGVKSVRAIYDYYKSNGVETVVMGASFRNTGQIKALAGCDRLTISPALLEELHEDEGALERKLSPDNASGVAKVEMDEAQFRWELNADAMATEKLAEGIRNFDADHKKLLKLISDRMA